MYEHSVHWGIKSAKCPSSAPFLGSEPQSFSSFSIFKFFILNTILKITKFLVKVPQFEFFVMTEKSIFVYKLFLLLNILDFSLSFM